MRLESSGLRPEDVRSPNLAAWKALCDKLGTHGAEVLLRSCSDEALGRATEFARSGKDGVLSDPLVAQPLTWSELSTIVPKTKTRGQPLTKEQIVALASKGNVDIKGKKWKSRSEAFEATALEVFKPRTKADLGLRRARMYDWVWHLERIGKGAELEEFWRKANEGWDYIWTMGMLALISCYRIDVWRKWVELGAADADAEHWGAVAKEVNNQLKSRASSIELLLYAEAAGIVGYRNLPFPGFDRHKEFVQLAQAGHETKYFGYEVRALLQKACPVRVNVDAKRLGWKQWLASLAWSTSGSSSVGKLKIRYTVKGEEKEDDVKCRKNTVMDFIDFEDLLRLCVEEWKQQNVVVIKNELGKVRLAVAGDLTTYLRQAWVLHLLGDAPSNWRGNASKEDWLETTERLRRMVLSVAKRFGFPFDYARFDHQPQTWEIVECWSHILDGVRQWVPEDSIDFFEDIVTKGNAAFFVATLVNKPPGEPTEEMRKTGGLDSGLRITSLLGDMFNQLKTAVCFEILNSWGVRTDDWDLWLKGDDTSLSVDTWGQGALMNECYAISEVEFGVGKFGLHYGATEFLRIWMDDRARGYPMRALMGIVQRKPWASTPWTPVAQLRAQVDAIAILRRRSHTVPNDLDLVEESLLRRWSQLTRIPVAAATAPPELGGLGIGVAKTPVRVSPALRDAPRVRGVAVLALSAWRERVLKEEGIRYNVELGDAKLKELANDQRVATLLADDVPIMARLARDQWNEEVRGSRRTLTKVSNYYAPLEQTPNSLLLSGEANKQLQDWCNNMAVEYGKYPEVEVARSSHRLYGEGVPFKEWLRLHFPRVSVAVGGFHRSWNLAMKLDYLGGSLSLRWRELHPMMMGIGSKIVAANMQPTGLMWDSKLWQLTRQAEEVLLNSNLVQKLYWW
jgi:hypothetical protein